jgi:hypothetical protein
MKNRLADRQAVDAYVQEAAEGSAEYGKDNNKRDIHFAVF